MANNISLPLRDKKTHKGQNGRVLIIGGNEIFHGAPALAGLGAEKTGADLLFLFVPPKHATVVRSASLNFIVQEFAGNFLSVKDVPRIVKESEHCDVLLIGNGLGTMSDSRQALVKILTQVQIPVVVDADGLIPEILKVKRNIPMILTPHDREFERVFEVSATEKNVQAMAHKQHCFILKKGPIDLIAGPKKEWHENKTGTPEMTVGGSGDALAGIIAGLVGQHLKPFEVLKTATFLWGKCGEFLCQKQCVLTAEDLVHVFPEVAKQYL
jgi:hydroxyethylthiazole kinase-like uncharacterized protein yjeF